MWIIAGHVAVDADQRETYVEAHRDLVARARQAPGCLDVAITADPVDPRRVNNYERWDSWEAIEAWRARANAPDPGIPLHDVDVTAYEVARSRPPFSATKSEIGVFGDRPSLFDDPVLRLHSAVGTAPDNRGTGSSTFHSRNRRSPTWATADPATAP